MKAVTLTSNYRVTLPADLRKRHGFKPGQKFSWVTIDGSVYLVPISGANPPKTLPNVRYFAKTTP